MKTIVLIENSRELIDDICQLITSSTGHRVISFTKASLALDFIAKSSPPPNANAYDLVICDYHLDGVNAETIYKALRKMSNDIPFILYTSEDLIHLGQFRNFLTETPGNGHLSKPASRNSFLAQIQKSLNLDLKDHQPTNPNFIIAEPLDSLFYGLPIGLAIRLNRSPVDFFIRLSEIKYVKIIKEDDSAIASILNKYLDRDVSYVYCEKSQSPKLYQALWDYYHNLEQNLALPSSRKLWPQVTTWFKIIGLQLQQLKIGTNLIEQNSRDLQLLIAQLDDKKYFHKYMKDIDKTSGLIFGHSLLTAWIIHAISPHISWMNAPLKSKLIACAIFHDLYLQDSEFDHEWISPRPENINLHINKILLQMEHDKLLSSEMSNVIRHHHLNITGKNKLNIERLQQLDAPSLLFNCCHELAIYFLTSGFDNHSTAAFLSDLNSSVQLKTISEFKQTIDTW